MPLASHARRRIARGRRRMLTTNNATAAATPTIADKPRNPSS
jgi:hypothetical protein